jgi:LysR family glycine cleavage system transcriptional activator
MSFAMAAAELHVTPAALSFQIKSLEQHLGAPVFRRLNRAVELTEAGKMLSAGTREGFEALNGAWRNTRRSLDTRTLTITAGPAFTAKWLAPRLFDFARKHPDIEVRFSATLRLVDLERDDVDVAIRFGEGGDEGLFSQPIINEWVTPMMTPGMAARLKTPADLYGATLLHQDDPGLITQSSNWGGWFAEAGLSPPPTGGPRFSQSDHAHDAAIAGSGVVLGRYSLAERALFDGLLVAPFELAIALKARYRIICPEGAQDRPHIRAFIDWVLEQVGHMQRCRDGRKFIAQKNVDRP